MTVNNIDLFVNAFTQYVVTPIEAFGLGGFVFDVEGDDTVNLNAEISDHFLEDNSTIQDHIAIRPKRLTLKRYVGELVDFFDGTPSETAIKGFRTGSRRSFDICPFSPRPPGK